MQKLPYKVVTACSFGTILEWYDFSIYAYLTPIIGLLFFPSRDSLTSIVLAYSVFAVGFLVRPLGAILIGHFGDRIGRKKVLVYSIVLIASSTTLIGILPTYSEVGKLAPILLIALRVLQGLIIGGEVIGAGSFVIESTQNERRGFATSIVWGSSGIGILLSAIVVSATTILMTNAELSLWGWRLPFLLGVVTGIAGYYLRKNTSESCQFNFVHAGNKIVKFPLLEAIRKFKAEMIIASGLYILSAIITYLIFVYMPVYASKTIGLPFSQTMAINSLIMTCMVLLVPVFGYCSDLFGRRIILLIGSMALLLFAFPAYVLIAHGNLIDLVIAQFMLAVLAASYQGAITRAVLELFPTNVRYSAVALSNNLTYSLFGSTAPIIAIYLMNSLKFNTAPSLYLIFGAFLSFIAALKMREINNTEDITQ